MWVANQLIDPSGVSESVIGIKYLHTALMIFSLKIINHQISHIGFNLANVSSVQSSPLRWIFKIVVKNNTHCNPPYLGADFSHYLSFRAASAPPSPVKRGCMCQHMVTASQRRAGGRECCASTRLSLPFYLTGSEPPLLSPHRPCWPAGGCSGVAFLAQEEAMSAWVLVLVWEEKKRSSAELALCAITYS